MSSTYETRVKELEALGLCTSDAQGVADAEFYDTRDDYEIERDEIQKLGRQGKL